MRQLLLPKSVTMKQLLLPKSVTMRRDEGSPIDAGYGRDLVAAPVDLSGHLRFRHGSGQASDRISHKRGAVGKWFVCQSSDEPGRNKCAESAR
jgi:hypothetical protein